MPRRAVPLLAAACVLAASVAGCASGTRAAAGPGPAGASAPSSVPSAAPSSASAAPSSASAERGWTAYSPLASATAAVPPVARPAAVPSTDPCAARGAAKWVLVDISDQRMWFCAARHTVRETPVTTGMAGPDTSTPTGHYAIQGINRDTTLTLNTGATYAVRYWIPFDAPLFGFHDSSWQHFPYGSARYRTAGSHGCVHMPLAQIAYLARWAPVGTPVTIRA
ncbi:MAG: L,D-transpeptidase [Jatrophihabitans sp.]|uniref:L,D-transpeptidase n=1 Tax=Jatrophihabitans sp. TaxID=1932789 RepID=UPI003F800744